MKYIILLGDGMADWPMDELNGRTPLEYAKTPNMDIIASGLKGMIKTVPNSLNPGSDVANLSVLGYDPTVYYTGRAPLEAISKSISMDENDVAYRCNLVNIENGIMKDFAAGHITTKKAKMLIDMINKNIKDDDIEFFSGVSYRNLMIWKNGMANSTTPPHDISDKEIENYLPKGEAKEKLIGIMNRTKAVLESNGIQKEANSIWLWGEGKKPSLPLFRDKFNKTGCVISAVDLMVGIGKLTECYIPEIADMTGFIDTNYNGKIEAAFNFFKDGGDFAYVHVEAIDETGHMGDLEAKIMAIELFDEKIVGGCLKMAEDASINLRIAVLPDHPTPIKIKTHTREPVPFAVFNVGQKDKKNGIYSEKSCREGIFMEKGYEFIVKVLFKE